MKKTLSTPQQEESQTGFLGPKFNFNMWPSKKTPPPKLGPPSPAPISPAGSPPLLRSNSASTLSPPSNRPGRSVSTPAPVGSPRERSTSSLWGFDFSFPPLIRTNSGTTLSMSPSHSTSSRSSNSSSSTRSSQLSSLSSLSLPPPIPKENLATFYNTYLRFTDPIDGDHFRITDFGKAFESEEGMAFFHFLDSIHASESAGFLIASTDMLLCPSDQRAAKFEELKTTYIAPPQHNALVVDRLSKYINLDDKSPILEVDVNHPTFYTTIRDIRSKLVTLLVTDSWPQFERLVIQSHTHVEPTP
jgi:hypothetical protein